MEKGKGRRAEESERKIRAEIAGHRARNRELHTTLVGYRVNFKRVRQVDLNFWATGSSAATQLATALKERGYRVKRAEPAVGEKRSGRWSVEAVANLPAETPLREDFSEDLVRLAAEFGGRYDGWGTSIDEALAK